MDRAVRHRNVLTLELLPDLIDTVALFVATPDAFDHGLRRVIVLQARTAQIGIVLLGRMAPVASGGICRTLLIGSTARVRRCLSMKTLRLEPAVEIRLGENGWSASNSR